MLDYMLSARLLLDTITQGQQVRVVVGRFVQVLAIAAGFGLLLSWIGLWTMIGSLSAFGALALTFSQVVLLGAMLKVMQVIYVRGEDICKTPESDFMMMNIFARLVRLPGEVALVFYLMMSVPALLLVATGAGNIIALFGVPVLAAHWAVAGVAAMITCWIIGFAAFVAFSLIGESASAQFSFAHDLRRTRQLLEAETPAMSSDRKLAA